MSSRHATYFKGKSNRVLGRRLARRQLRLEHLEARWLLSGETTLIGPGADWLYPAEGTNLDGVSWQDVSFADNLWASGPAELGYGDGDEATVLDSTSIYPCYYFRHGFEVTDPAAYESLTLNIIRDDGAVAYLNGQEVARSNMPAGEITYYTWSDTAIGGDDPDEGTWHGFAVDAALLLSGANVVAVEVHQCHATSSDVSFNLELTGVPPAVPVPGVALISPADDSIVNSTEVSFTCSATDDVGLTDATLYVGGQSETVTFSGLTDTDDAQISADQPDVNLGIAVGINVDGENPHAHAVIKFPNMFGDGPGQVPLGSTIVSASASLEVNCTNAGNPLKLYRLTEDWVEGEVTWNERANGLPWTDAGADGTGSHAGVALDGYCSATGIQTVDITPFVQEWSDGAANYGIVMTDTGTDGIDFDSSESGQPPLLSVTYGSPMEAIETQPLSGTSDTATFTTTLSDDGDYLWNCLVTNTSGQESWAPADFLLTVDTNSPDQPVLVAPADGATGVSTSPMLEVTVSDPNGDPLDVTFYGGGDSAGEDFTIVVLPDTQKYSQSYPEIFTAQTQWIKDNVDALNTVFVTHEGDIVETWDSTAQWDNANYSMSLLDGVVPYGVLPGNHDQPTTYYNLYFPDTRYESEPWYGDHYDDTNDNNYQLFSAGGNDYIIVHLEYAPSSEVITWADSMLETYVDRKAIITTHSYLNGDGTRTAPGNTVWNDLVVPNDNVYFVLCGHVADEYTRTDVVNGREVHQLLADYQNRTNGGDGWLRTMRFAPSEDTVYVETYSPWLDQYETDADSQFTLDFEMNGFSVIDTQTVDSGSTASVVWPGLSMDEQYDWYATVTDTTAKTTTGPTWSFTTGTNQPPVAVNDLAYSVDEDNTLTVSDPGVLGNDSDPEGDPLTAILVSNVSNGSLTLNSDGSFDYTPGLNFNGSDSFTYKANDGTGDSNTATVSITVNAVNDAPVAANDAAATEQDTPVTVDVLSNDADPENDSLSIFIVDASNGEAVVDDNSTPSDPTDDTVEFTPADGYTGPASFTYRVYDGSLFSNVATVAITVTVPVDDPPIAVNDTAVTAEDTMANVDVLANDTDPEGNPLQITIVGVTNGTAMVNDNDTPGDPADDTVDFTPTADFNGNAGFTYTVNDGQLDSNVATVSVTVTAVNDDPTVANPIDDFTVDEDAVDTVMSLLGVFDDADVLTNGDSLSFEVIDNTNPGLLSAAVEGGDLRLSYAANQHGNATVTVRATDAAFASVDDVFSVTVNGVNDAPVAVDDAAVTGEDVAVAVDVLLNDSDVDGDTLTVDSFTQATDGTVVNDGNGTFTYTPDAGFDGADSFSYTVSDGNGGTDTAIVTITVNASATDDVAIRETTTYGSVVSGSLADTYDTNDGSNGNDAYQVLQEEQFAGGNRTRLEHTWEFDVTGGATVTFYLKGYHESTVENFAFAEYSTDGGVWTTMLDVSTNPDEYQKYDLPASTSGTVLVRVTDTDRSKEGVQDIVYIDHMFIRSEGQPGAPVVTIAATDAEAAEEGTDPGTFTVTRTGDTSGALAVDFSVGGTATEGLDYVALARTVTIPAGDSSVTITITPEDDGVVDEGNETVALTLAAGAGYTIGSSASDMVTIVDNDTASTIVDDYAIGESTAQGEVTAGDLTNTNESDDIYEAVQEDVGDRRSSLEHVWEFDVTGGSSVTFFVEAHHDSSVEDFAFEYSTDGVNWTQMVVVTKTADDNSYQTFDVAPATSGTVFVRVIDTDNANKEISEDTIYIDDMFFRSE